MDKTQVKRDAALLNAALAVIEQLEVKPMQLQKTMRDLAGYARALEIQEKLGIPTDYYGNPLGIADFIIFGFSDCGNYFVVFSPDGGFTELQLGILDNFAHVDEIDVRQNQAHGKKKRLYNEGNAKAVYNALMDAFGAYDG